MTCLQLCTRPCRPAVASLVVWLCFGASIGFGGDFVPIVGWGRQLFPSYIIASASIKTTSTETEESDPAKETTIGDANGTLGIVIEAPKNNSKIEVTISADDWLTSSTISGVLPTKGTSYRVLPTLKYKYATLAKTHQTTPTTVTYKVKLDGKDLPEQSETLVLHSINDCPFAINSGEGQQSIDYVFAAYVNEQHPFVDKILREALDSGIVDSFTGYQSGDEADVLRQVYAIWHALSERDLRYSNITSVAGESDAVYCQHVRLIDESINNGQANCVDGSVLLASILRKIDIEPHLVFVPGHCYLAFALDEAGEHLVALETTMIGSTPSEDVETIEELDDLLDEESLELNSYATFCDAFATGCEDLESNAEKFDSDDDRSYQLISINAARKMGVLPIAFQSGEKFKSNQ